MKSFNKILTVALILTLAQFSFSAFGLSPRVSGGISNFYGMAPINGLALEPSYSMDAGLHFLVLSLSEGGRVTLEPEVMWSYMRSYSSKNVRNAFNSGEKTAEVTRHSIDIPILLQIDISKFFIELGPKVGYNFSSMTAANNSAFIKTENDTEDLNKINAGLVLGLGMEIISNLAIDIRGTYDVREFAEDTYGKPWTLHLGLRYKVL